jgi:hypothetical protein
MRTSDYHDPLTCADLALDQKKLDDARDACNDTPWWLVLERGHGVTRPAPEAP